MENRLKKTDYKFLSIIYAIWNLVSYYGKLFQIDAGDEPLKTSVKLSEKNGITVLRFTFNQVFTKEYRYPPEQMKSIYNDYLRYVILPSINELRPFIGDSGIYGIMEPLYIDKITTDMGLIHLDVIYIDNHQAFNYVRDNEKSDTLRGI